ncbi:hypothetical protein PRBRB14_08420 [Hallella multisaccharivorax DSM 17128]|uniref:Outer membrane protein beta-barrel domain-containing protein n=1 Tax=Hallella multisaccharivorax DSM 17128 TaxID=688246 RepID=F8N7S9_9BACT|nr:hypothetical protein [Hallella multisaccharivorax]EGN56434.1 hypothetical protein Premu_0992 [Hallella multisaccharivorax DSM 17128]GJG29963.1 hypothetical protein PRBRB14_08420 [Hallella multisaccharivorax DSM 17128]
MCFLATKGIKAQTDSIKTDTLQEVVVTADGQIETADKAVLLPTTLEKRHSTNAFDLLSVMQPPELDVSSRTRNITTHSGGEVVLCINGMEALPEDVAALRAKNIRSIEYIRTPSGKYAGKAGLVNFITVKMDYGGNVYLSATEGLAYKNGDYLAYTDFKRKGLTTSLTASGDWSHDNSYTDGQESFRFTDQSALLRDYASPSSIRKNNDQAVRLRVTSTGKNHRLNAYVSLNRQAVPKAETNINTTYSGKSEGQTKRLTSSDGRNLSPTLYANYTVWLPKNQTLDFTMSGSFGHNRYNSRYTETRQDELTSSVKENSNSVQGSIQYLKSLEGGLNISGSLQHDHNHYKDTYSGSSTGVQRLTTEGTMALLQVSKYSQKYYYYVSAGVSNSAVSLNDVHYDYCVPVAFYGGNYAFSDKHSFSLNGLFTHTLFSPSDKNSMTVPTSFFEATCGNPDLKPMKVLGNTLSYNGQAGKSRFSISYASNIYFDNILHRYTADNRMIFDTRVNDGTFYGNMLSASYTYNLFDNRLRLSATAIEEYNMLRGETYDMSRNIFRFRASATYLTGDWTLRLGYRTPYTTLDIREPYLISRRPVYELLARWNHKDWSIEALVRNPFCRYNKQHMTMDYGCYNRDLWRHSESDGRNISLTVTYSLGYGKKTERGDTEINKTVNSAIMKTY